MWGGMGAGIEREKRNRTEQIIDDLNGFCLGCFCLAFICIVMFLLLLL
jgi:hypothetical protein